MSRNSLLTLVSLAFVAAPLGATSGGGTLKEIMQELHRNFVEVTDGFLLDDFEAIANGALAIAEHPGMPESQIEVVTGELGAEMPVFNNFDVQVHELSLELYQAAMKQDRAAAVTAYQGMVAACFACHAAYRERVAAALNADR